jgi:RNA-splicing ligase RtcB
MAIRAVFWNVCVAALRAGQHGDGLAGAGVDGGAIRETLGSVCHGAGRLMSRTAVRKGRDARQETKKLEAGILVRSETRDGISEELPEAHKKRGPCN